MHPDDDDDVVEVVPHPEEEGGNDDDDESDESDDEEKTEEEFVGDTVMKSVSEVAGGSGLGSFDPDPIHVTPLSSILSGAGGHSTLPPLKIPGTRPSSVPSTASGSSKRNFLSMEAIAATITQAREAMKSGGSSAPAVSSVAPISESSKRKAPEGVQTRSTKVAAESPEPTPDLKKRKKMKLPQMNPVLSIPLHSQSQSEYVSLGKTVSENFATLSSAPAALEPTRLAHKMVGCCAQLLLMSASLGSTVPVLESGRSKSEAENEVLRSSLDVARKELESVSYRCEKMAALDKANFKRITQQDNRIGELIRELEGLREDAEKHNAVVADLSVYYTLRARIEMMSTSPEARAAWDLPAEIATFKQLFPGEPILEEVEVTSTAQPGAGSGAVIAGEGAGVSGVDVPGPSHADPTEENA